MQSGKFRVGIYQGKYMLQVICGLPFYALWIVAAGYVIRGGVLAISQRYVQYKFYLPATKVRYQLTGGAVRIIGVMQVCIGVMLVLALGFSLFDRFRVLQGIVVSLMCLSLPLYYFLVRFIMRFVDVQFSEAIR
jgi:hypothetical protein